MKPERRKRLFSVLTVIFFSFSGISLILYALNSNLDYFFTPTEINERVLPETKRIKIGGMVAKNSVTRNGSEILFTITDYQNSIRVKFNGLLPDLFKEESGVVVLGYLENDIFNAQEVLAKHDENYMPPNLEIKNDN